MENHNRGPEEKKLNQESTEIAAFVLGIASLVLALSIFSGTQLFLKLFIGLAAAIVALTLGITVNKVRKTRMGTTAIVTSVISMCLYTVSIFACVACMATSFSVIEALL